MIWFIGPRRACAGWHGASPWKRTQNLLFGNHPREMQRNPTKRTAMREDAVQSTGNDSQQKWA